MDARFKSAFFYCTVSMLDFQLPESLLVLKLLRVKAFKNSGFVRIVLVLGVGAHEQGAECAAFHFVDDFNLLVFSISVLFGTF